ASSLPPRLNGACLQLLAGDVPPPQPSFDVLVGVSPPQPCFGVLPRLADVSRLPPRLKGVCVRLLVGDVPPRLAGELRPLGVLPATTILVLMLYRCLRRIFRLVGQPRSKMHRGAANSVTARIDGYR